VVSGGWRVEVVGWRASLPVGHSHTPNDDDSIVIIFFCHPLQWGCVGMENGGPGGGPW